MSCEENYDWLFAFSPSSPEREYGKKSAWFAAMSGIRKKKKILLESQENTAGF